MLYCIMFCFWFCRQFLFHYFCQKPNKTLFGVTMEKSGSLFRNRRLESFLNTSSDPTVKEAPKVLVKEEAGQRPRAAATADVYVDDDGWLPTLISVVRIVVCFVSMMFTTFIWALIMILLLPWPYERVRQGNVYGHVTGRMLVSHFSDIMILVLRGNNFDAVKKFNNIMSSSLSRNKMFDFIDRAMFDLL